MIKVITAYHKPHEKFLPFCKDSVSGYGVYHDIQFDYGRGQTWAIRELLSRVEPSDIVCILDADDMATANMFENIALLEDYDLVYGDVVNISKSGISEIYRAQPLDRKLFMKKNIIPVSGVVAKGWLLKTEEYPDMFHGKDHLWWHLLLRYSHKFHYEPGVVAIRRTWTSYKRCNIPVYRKLRRLYYEYKLHQAIKKLY